MKTIGNTCYKFPNRNSGKTPEFDGSVKLKRKNKKYSERILRYWQAQAFKKLFLSKFFLVKAFCGAGKTTLSVVMALYDIIKNGRKQIFIVPQEHIGDGFAVSGVFAVPNVGSVHLSSAQNFCEDSEHKVEMLVNFIKRKFSKKDFAYGKEFAVDGSEMIAVCTHSAFNMAIKKIIEDEDFDKLTNISFYIDEAHHIKGGDIETDVDYNQLGEIIYKIINNSDKKNFRIGMTTATYFRGDQGIIVKKDYLDRFDRYELDFLEHFDTLGIDTVNVNFEEYEEDPIKQIVENIRKELNEYHLIVVPTKSSKWRKKDLNLEKLKKYLRKMLIEEGLNPDEAVLDLVTVSTQKINKAILLKEPKETYDDENPSKIRIVITCMLGREGTDWCACSRLHNASIELGSTTLAVQTLGRLFRKFHNKNNVSIIYYIKRFNELDKSKNKREFLSDRVNAILCLMMIDDLMNPILLPELPLSAHVGPKRVHNKNKNRSEGIKLNDVFGDDFEDVKKKIIEMASIHIEFNEDVADSIIQEVIIKYNLQDIIQVKNGEITKITSKEDVVAGLKVFLLRARAEALRSKGIDISLIRKAGFDYLVEKNKLKGNFWCGLNKDKLHKFTKIIGKCFWSKGQIKCMADNIRKVLAKELGCELMDTDRNHAKLVKETLKKLRNFHEIYNNCASDQGSVIPNRKNVAEKLDISLFELDQKVIFFNQILPKGYYFFDKKSKLSEKLALDFAA